jgi:hypothetical protein
MIGNYLTPNKFGAYLQNKNVYSLMFMLVIIHRAYVLKLLADSQIADIWKILLLQVE